MLQARADEKKKEGEKGWSVWGYVKKFYGIVMMLGLLKMLLFPGALPELTPTIKDPTNMRDLAKLNLNQSEMDQIFSSPTVEDKRLTISKIVSKKNKEKELEAKKFRKEGDERVQDYFNAKIKGKSSNKEIFFSVKDDFQKFAEFKGGVVMKVYKLLDKYVQRNDTEEMVKV